MIDVLIAKYLQTNGIATIGEDLFVYHMPPQAKNGILVRTPLYGVQKDLELPGYYHTKIQVIVRANRFPTGRARMSSIISTLEHHGDRVISYDGVTHTVKRMLSLTLPVSYPRAESGDIEFSVDFDTVYIDH